MALVDRALGLHAPDHIFRLSGRGIRALGIAAAYCRAGHHSHSMPRQRRSTSSDATSFVQMPWSWT